MPTEAGVFPKTLAEHGSEKYILELQPAERGLQRQILEADLVLWTVGSKPPLPQLEPCDRPHELPLNGRGQAETDETLRVKGHPRIFALGDSSALRDMNGRILPATAQVLYYFNFLDVEENALFHFPIRTFSHYQPPFTDSLLHLSGCFPAGRFYWLEFVGSD